MPTTETRDLELVALDAIAPNPSQPRGYPADEVAALTESIKERGLLQPLLVRRHGDGYELIAGNRRLQAARRAGLRQVPVMVRDTSDGDMLALALVENEQRTDLTPIDRARAYRRLREEQEMHPEEIAALVGRSREGVINTMRLLDLPDSVQARLARRELSEGHGRALLVAGDTAAIEQLAAEVIAEGLSVREAERRARRAAGLRPKRRAVRGSKAGGRSVTEDAELRSVSRQIAERVGLPVEIAGTMARGRVEIRYASMDELTRLCDALGIG